MPFPYLFRKLFQNDGAGELLNKGVIPPSYVDTAAQAFTDKEKAQARANIGATTATDVINESSGLRLNRSTNAIGKTVAYLKSEIEKWTSDSANLYLSTFAFNANTEWIKLWNADDTTTKLTSGNDWLLTKIGKPLSTHTAYLVSDYMEGYLFYLVVAGGKVGKVRQINMDATIAPASLSTSRVTSTWRSTDGALWYRKYSDGWIEQGGFDVSTTSTGGVVASYTKNKTVTFPVAFRSRNYQLLNVGFVIAGAGQQTIVSKTATGFKTASNVNEAGTSGWFACGY